jgi:hypothetical protein
MIIETTEQLLTAMDAVASTPPRAVSIRGFGDIHIREITIGEVDAQIADEADSKKKRGAARGACRLLCNSSGKQLLDPDNPEHVAQMSRQPLRVLLAINKAADLFEAESGN